jgi:hypothetical protein
MSVANILEALDKEIADLTQARTVLVGLDGSTVKVTAVKATGKRTFSAAARRKMAAAQKARWAKARSGRPSAKPQSTKRTRVMSISARRKIAAAQKARWAMFRAKKAA